MLKKIGAGLWILTLCFATSCNINVDKTKKEAEKEAKKLVELPSGLKFEILSKGAGTQIPNQGQKVAVHYTGWLEDATKPEGKGQKFDSSVDRGEKFTFALGVGQVIKGWDEGVKDMVIGEKRRLVVPHQLAYGDRGIPGAIPANSNLVFEVELLEIL